MLGVDGIRHRCTCSIPHTILVTLPAIASFRELREDCGVDPGRVKHLQRLEAKRGTITAFFAKQVISFSLALPSLPPASCLLPLHTLLADYDDLRLTYNLLWPITGAGECHRAARGCIQGRRRGARRVKPIPAEGVPGERKWNLPSGSVESVGTSRGLSICRGALSPIDETADRLCIQPLSVCSHLLACRL